ncbi:MAG TPA: PRC-barrel domain-containing protein [Methanomassiliicoccales archaeon]|nr:PRC-barrel domain-containing protein [Methanomassiliicoccales archaeon]
MVSMKDLLSKSVLTSDAYDIGTVNDFQVSLEDWSVAMVGVNLNAQSKKDLGIKKIALTGVTLCIPIAQVDKVGDMVTLRIDFDHLKDLPECKSLR